MVKNSFISLVVFCVLVFCGYLLYQDASTDTPTPVMKQSQNSQSIKQEDVKNTEPNTEEKVETKVSATEGIHIMPDGTVMAKDGTVVVGASILQNGTIKLKDGTIVIPVMDMRPKTNTKPEVATSKPTHHVVDVVGVDFSYDIKQIKAKRGDTITVNFKSNEGFHDFVIDELDVASKRVTENDSVTSVTFVADTVGTFQYYCSVMSHRQMGMVGYLTISEK